MGKAALLMVIASTIIMVGVSSTRIETEVEMEGVQATYEEKVLAREAAISFFNILEGKTLADFDGFRTQNESVRYKDALMTFSAVGNSSDEVGLSAVAYVGKASHSIVGTVVKAGGMPLAAVTIDGAIGNMKAAGNKFTITGLDTNPGEAIGAAGDPTYGIHATKQGTADTFIDAIDASQITGIGNMDGLSADHSVYHGPTLDLNALYDNITSYANNKDLPGAHVYDGDQTYHGNDIIGSPTEPVVMVVNGDMDLGGTVSGYGVLLVNGDLSVAHGTPRWEGLIYATGVHADGTAIAGGSSEFKGTVDIYGALILRTTNDDYMTKEENESTTLDFSINGDVNLMYSSKALSGLPGVLIPSIEPEPTTLVMGEIREMASRKLSDNTYSNYSSAGGG